MYQRILVPLDGSATSSAGLAEAVKVAELTGGTVQLLHAIDEMPLVLAADGYGAMSGDIMRIMKETGQRILADAKRMVEFAGVPVNTILLDTLNGRVDEIVINQATEWKADLIVIGTHGRRGVQRMVLGSDAERILRKSQVPVLMVRGASND